MNRCELKAADVHYVASHMRQVDRDEIFATRFTNDPGEVVDSCMAVPDFAWTMGLERPIAVIGAIPSHPGCWTMYMFATDEFRRISTGLTKFVKRSMIPWLTQSGARRLQCLSIEGHIEAHRWLELFGAKREAVLSEYGRDGQDFYVYSLLCRRGEQHV